MTRETFKLLTEKLKSGDNGLLSLLQAHQSDCIEMLVRKSNNTCSADDAYDIFIDSVMDFRKNILGGKVEYGNVKAYLKRICWNKWLAHYRAINRLRKKEEDVRHFYYGQNEPENEDARMSQDLKINSIKEAMSALTEKCRDILHWAIVDSLSMDEIANMLGLANANVAKTTKSRCYKKLLSTIKQHTKP